MSGTSRLELGFGLGRVDLVHEADTLFEYVRDLRWHDSEPRADAIRAELIMRPRGSPRLPDRAVRTGYTSRHQFYEIGERCYVATEADLLIEVEPGARRMTVDYRVATDPMKPLVGRSLATLLIAVAHQAGAHYLPVTAWETRGHTLLVAGQPRCGRERLISFMGMGREDRVVSRPALFDRQSIYPFPVPPSEVGVPTCTPMAATGREMLLWVTSWNTAETHVAAAEPGVLAKRLEEIVRRRLLPHSTLWRDFTLLPRLNGVPAYEVLLGDDPEAARRAISSLLAYR